MDFSASHQLRNYQGRCERLHGHNFGVEVEVRGSELKPDTGILVDFKELKAEVATVLGTLDHRHLNELEPFREANPSSEHLARHIFRELKPRVRAMGVELLAVSVSEKPSSVATYCEDPA
jgi:6-pyruvoyltetrahydropterin/6-carboxytetrahydropterin synthase